MLRRIAFPILLLLCTTLSAEDTAHAWPLWNGQESVADYAKRVNLSPTLTLELGADAPPLELVLIPAGKFVMGTPDAAPPNEAAFKQEILYGQIALGAGVAVLLTCIIIVIFWAVEKGERPKFSLGLFVVFVFGVGLTLGGAFFWWQTIKRLADAKKEFEAVQQRNRWYGKDEKPAHQVTLTRPFYVGKYTVTQAQFQGLTGKNYTRIKGPTLPVESVRQGVDNFCKLLSDKSAQTVRLPTEAEWEFACRAGTTTQFYNSDSEGGLGFIAWYAQNSGGVPHPVGEMKPNAFGLYDMLGNVPQWCQDRYSESYYAESPLTDPKGPEKSDKEPDVFATRGGGCFFQAVVNRCANRSMAPVFDFTVGFRVVVEVSSIHPNR